MESDKIKEWARIEVILYLNRNINIEDSIVQGIGQSESKEVGIEIIRILEILKKKVKNEEI